VRPDEVMVRRGVSGSEQLDELQRGHDPCFSLEEMDRGNPSEVVGTGPTEVPQPDQGQRPGAVRIAEEQDEPAEGDE
jgi:hypothetical protein